MKRFIAVLVMLCSGCGTIGKLAWWQATHPGWEQNLPYTNSAPDTATNAMADDIDISAVAEILPNKNRIDPVRAPVVTPMGESAIRGTKLNFNVDLDALKGWDRKEGKKTTDGMVCLAVVRDGRVIVFDFDHHGVGQTVKGLENVIGDYCKGQRPDKGETVYVGIVGYNAAKGRTSFKKCSTPWPGF
jgi:hypothetical protein